MTDILVEMVKTKSGLTDSKVATFEAHRGPSMFEEALHKAIKLHRSDAYEVWRALQLLVSNQSVEGQPVAAVNLAMEFNPFPATWKVIADKALEYEFFSVKRKP